MFGVSNEDFFVKCDVFLGLGGVLFIVLEGGSVMECCFCFFKMGIVWIVLSVVEKKNFDLDIFIWFIGVYYDWFNKFGLVCVINVGELIKVKDW